MNYSEALPLIGGLSHPSKMPWWAWSISAEGCITGSKLAQHENTVCSGCYALKGHYLFPNVKDAHQRRLQAVDHPDFVEAFITVLTQLYDKVRKRRAGGARENRFRWFDAGDLQSVEMLVKINEIARGTPFIDHWLPTREVSIVSEFFERGNSLACNLSLRLSAPIVGQLPKGRVAGMPFATVGCDDASGSHQCQALVSQGNRCLDCDQCWKPDVDVNYPLH